MHKLAFDHAVIYVPNLKRAISQFTALGFTVKLGGEHTHTHNALIIFNDRSYIELLALKQLVSLAFICSRKDWTY